MAPEAFFLPVADGHRFCVYHPAQSAAPKGAVIYLHPFAEEMNKSRRMAACQSRLLAAHGFSVLQIDLHGCGDSSGDFADATWDRWLDDVRSARACLRDRCQAPLWVWGLRTGCLLAADAAPTLGEPASFLFWQPASSGKLILQQFLRLKAAGEMLSGEGKGVVESLKRQLANGESPEIGGYALSPGLARGLEAADLQPPADAGRLVWLEVAARADATLAPASQKRLEQWQARGFDVVSGIVNGPAFWQTTEIEDAPALLQATVARLEEAAR